MNIVKKRDIQTGFTLIEALVAIGIVLLGVTAAFSSAQFGLSSTSAVRNRVTAMYLAQEAIEGVKNMKDSNVLKLSAGVTPAPDWLDGINPNHTNMPCSSLSNQTCGYDIGNGATSGSFARCASTPGSLQGCVVFSTSESGADLYQQKATTGGTDTGFVREIWVEETVDDAEARVTVVVRRPGTNFPPFRIESLIYNWF
jgi:type II secretory pathway pseudopilin PulG